jgi:hypothetical protein
VRWRDRWPHLRSSGNWSPARRWQTCARRSMPPASAPGDGTDNLEAIQGLSPGSFGGDLFRELFSKTSMRAIGRPSWRRFRTSWRAAASIASNTGWPGRTPASAGSRARAAWSSTRWADCRRAAARAGLAGAGRTQGRAARADELRLSADQGRDCPRAGRRDRPQLRPRGRSLRAPLPERCRLTRRPGGSRSHPASRGRAAPPRLALRSGRATGRSRVVVHRMRTPYSRCG